MNNIPRFKEKKLHEHPFYLKLDDKLPFILHIFNILK